MARGQRAKLTAVRKANGNPSGRPLNKKEAESGVKIPPPNNLPAIASRMYRDVVALLGKMGYSDKADKWAVELLAYSYWEWREAIKVVREEGPTFVVVDSSGNRIPRVRPEFRIASDAWKRVKSSLEELGLTPASRVKFGGDADLNELDNLLKEMGKN